MQISSIIIRIGFLTLIAIVAFYPPVSGLIQELRKALVESYKNPKFMIREYLQLDNEKIKTGKMDPCFLNACTLVELSYTYQTEFQFSTKIKFGIFNDRKGFNLIVDEFNSIHLPAIIECTPKFMNGSSVKIKQKMFVYYLVYYKYFNTPAFERALFSSESESKFVLADVQSVEDHKYTYITNSTQKKMVNKWFKLAVQRERNGRKECEMLSRFGVMKDETAVEWNIIDGIIKHGHFQLRLTTTIEVQIRGIFICDVEVKKTSNITPNVSTEKRYFTIARLDREENNTIYSYIYGPKSINKKTTFALFKELFNDAPTPIK